MISRRALLAGTGAALLSSSVQAQEGPVRGLDRFMLEGGNGRSAPLSDILPDGQNAILHFWATWCGPCRDELPSLARYAETLRNNGQANQLIIIATESAPRAKIDGFLRDDLNLPNFLTFQDKAVRAKGTFRLFGIPETILLNADGSVAARKTGAMPWDSAQFRGGLQAFLTG